MRYLDVGCRFNDWFDYHYAASPIAIDLQHETLRNGRLNRDMYCAILGWVYAKDKGTISCTAIGV